MKSKALPDAMEYQTEEAQRLIEEVKRKFFDKGTLLNQFDERDIERINNDDLYVWLFIKHKQKDVDKAIDMIVDCLRWRESFGINDLLERNIDRRLFEIGFLYVHNFDKNGHPLVLFHTRLYRKDAHNPKEVKKLVAFGLEKLSREHPGGKVTLIFDMQDSSLANMDMDLIKFLITNFQVYYPCMLEYLIVLEMPWILSAAWKIVKTWLSTEGISKIKFVNKTEIVAQYVDADQLLIGMGGTDDFKYQYPPQLANGKKDTKSKPSNAPIENNQDLEFSSISVSMSTDIHGKPVNSSDAFELLTKTGDDSSSELLLSDSMRYRGKNEDITKSTQQKHNRRRDETSKKKSRFEFIGPLITICPADEIVFCGAASTSGELLSILTITNTISTNVAYKVKTTSPENYRVRPSSGLVPPENSVEINIYLQPGHTENVNRDKFLILSALVPEKEKSADIGAIWKQIPKSSVLEHRLRCRFEVTSMPAPYTDTHDSGPKSPKHDAKIDPLESLRKILEEKIIEDLQAKVNDSHSRIVTLERNIRIILCLLCIIVAFALTYAVLSPILKTYTSKFDRLL
ncbi:motile sperm domain-containing protein 2-like isoform X2 [Rhopilema esculentum]|uniref:motile sperm domain-containing protein 2-like isoform X2 n=1 Tax=Rhopilema esculentum TaxID=499914 RepID=UPI0031D41DAB